MRPKSSQHSNQNVSSRAWPAPVGGRHVRVMNLYDASFYRGPADLNATQSH